MRKVFTQKMRWSVRDVLSILVGAVVLIYIYKLFEPYLVESLKSRYPHEGDREMVHFLIGALTQAAILTGLVAFILKKRGGRLAQLGLAGKGTKKALSAGIVGGLVIFGLVLVSGEAAQYFFSEVPRQQPLAKVIAAQKSWMQLVIPFFVGSVLAPVSEEIYFRGFTYPVLRARLGKYFGMLLSGAFFAALHFDLIRFFPLLVGGIGLAWLYEKHQSLYTPIMAHAVWNTSMALLLVVNNMFG